MNIPSRRKGPLVVAATARWRRTLQTHEFASTRNERSNVDDENHGGTLLLGEWRQAQPTMLLPTTVLGRRTKYHPRVKKKKQKSFAKTIKLTTQNYYNRQERSKKEIKMPKPKGEYGRSRSIVVFLSWSLAAW